MMNGVNDAVDQYEEITDPRSGKKIKSAFGTDFFRSRFVGQKKPRPNAMHLIFLDDDYGDRREHVHAYLKEIGVEFKNCVDINKIGKRSYILEFVNIDWRRYAITRTLQSFGKHYKVYPLVSDTIKLHVGSIPPYMSDGTVLNYLRCFGTFSDDPQDITTEEDEFRIRTGTRIYTASDIATHIPSYTWINGEQMTIFIGISLLHVAFVTDEVISQRIVLLQLLISMEGKSLFGTRGILHRFNLLSRLSLLWK